MARKDQTKEAAIAPGKSSSAPVINREVLKSPEFVSLYANDVQVQITPWDIRLTLGEISDVPNPQTPIIKILQLADLRLSPPLAKRLATLMLEQIKAYEESFGEIPTPKG